MTDIRLQKGEKQPQALGGTLEALIGWDIDEWPGTHRVYCDATRRRNWASLGRTESTNWGGLVPSYLHPTSLAARIP